MKHILFFTASIFISIHMNAQIPVLDWAKNAGGSGSDIALASTLDAAGNTYTTGHFEGLADFDPGAGVYNLQSNGNLDIFILKLDNSGNFVWARNVGGLLYDEGKSITHDASGNIYVTGIFKDTADFDPGPGVFSLISAGDNDIFILKLDSAGNFEWAKSIGGTGDDEGNSIVAGNSGNVYTTGYFYATADFDPGIGVYNLTSLGYNDFFISKIDASGNFMWAKQIGGIYMEMSYSISLDAQESVYTAGTFTSDTIDFDPGSGTYNIITGNGEKSFISKLNASGNFIWAKCFKGSPLSTAGIAWPYAMTTDASGNIYITGEYGGSIDFDPDTSTFVISTINHNVFVYRLDSAGHFIWVKEFMGSDMARGLAITTDAGGNVYTTGWFMSPPSGVDFDPGPGVYKLWESGVYENMFVSKLDMAGNFVWAFAYQSFINTDGCFIKTDGSGSIYLSGYFSGSADFDPDSTNTYYLTSSGSQNIFVEKLHESATGIIENILSNSNTLSPNPTHGDFTVLLNKQYKNINLRIFNVAGQRVFNARYPDTNIINVKMEAPAGIYFAEMKNDEGVMERMKVVKID